MPHPLDLLAAEHLLQLVSRILCFDGVVLVGYRLGRYRHLLLHDLVYNSGLAALEWGFQLLQTAQNDTPLLEEDVELTLKCDRLLYKTQDLRVTEKTDNGQKKTTKCLLIVKLSIEG